MKIHKSLIRPIITYGAEAWTLNTETTKRLTAFERKVLWRILGAVKINVTWKGGNNSELANLYNDVDIALFIRLSRLR